jgi:glycosyltransferase involved in cell wall biosynthesis
MKKLIIKSQKQFYDHCNAVLIPTLAMKAELLSYNFRTDHMVLWERGLDKNLFDPKKRKLNYIRSIVNNNKPNLLFASRLVWEKNLETLIRLNALLKKKGRNYNLIIAGDGVASQSLKNQMPDAVFLGNIDHEELSVLYASCDVFVFPSDSETYGNVVIEAMASGLACVIANGGGSASFVEHGINGFKVKAHEEKDYLEAIDLIINDQSLRQQFIDNSLEFTKYLSWDHLAQRYFKLIESLSVNKTIPQVA